MHSQRVMCVWCVFCSGCIIGKYIFENADDIAVTVNRERYRHKTTNFLWNKLNDMNLGGMWFQQDSATYHTAWETITLLHQLFSNRLISKNGDVNRPQRSRYSTSLYYFFTTVVHKRLKHWKPVKFIPDIGEIQHQTCKEWFKILTKRSIIGEMLGAAIFQILYWKYQRQIYVLFQFKKIPQLRDPL